MSLLTDLYQLPIATIADFPYAADFKLANSVSKSFSLEIDDLDAKVLDFNTLIIWNFGDPFNGIANNDNEIISTNVLQNVSHSYEYAGNYVVRAVVNINNYFFIIERNVQVFDLDNVILIDPVPSFYQSSVIVSFICFDNTAKIYYTTDGSDPFTSATRVRYSDPFTLVADTVVSYAAELTTGDLTTVKTAEYKIMDVNAELTIAPDSSYFYEPVEISFAYDTAKYDCNYSTDDGLITNARYSLTGPFTITNNTRVIFCLVLNVDGTDFFYHNISKQYYVDTAEPALTITPTNEGVMYYNDNLQVTLTPNKSGTFISYSISGGEWVNYTAPFNINCIADLGLENGVYNVPLSAAIRDNADRIATYSLTYPITVDTVIPVIQLITTPPLSAVMTNFLFEFMVSEVSLVSVLIDVSINGGTYQTYTVDGESYVQPGVVYSYQTPEGSCNLGLNSITFKSTDLAGNTSEQTYYWYAVEFKMDPVLSWAPVDLVLEGEPLTSAELSVTASVSGITTYTTSGATIRLGDVLLLGTYDVVANFTPLDTYNFNPVTISNVIEIAPFMVTNFILGASQLNNSTISIVEITGNLPIVGYIINESGITPALDDAAWSATKPTEITY